MPDISLRPYQQKFIDDVRNEFKNHKRIVGVAPCGAGKTVITGWMIRQAVQRGKKSVFFVHRKELIEQTAKTFSKLHIPFGIICSGEKQNLTLPVQIASVQTLASHIDELKKFFQPNFLICDECHHILANSYKKILNAFPDAYLLGVTATPQRMGGKTLSDIFDAMVQGPTVNQLIQLGNLTPFNYFAAPLDINLDDVRIRNGDFDNSDLERRFDNKAVTGDIVENYIKFAYGKSSICYCVNVNHSKNVAQAFNDAGILAEHVDGDTPNILRNSYVKDFRLGKIKVLCNAELFSEGFDVPRCQAVILARPTKSLTLFIQQAMRPLRPDPDDKDKIAVIIDCVQNRERHGLPNDFHSWSLAPNCDEKPSVCPHCKKSVIPKIFLNKKNSPIDFSFDNGNFFLNPDNHGSKIKIVVKDKIIFEDKTAGQIRKICPNCGFLFPLGASPFENSSRRIVKQREGELGEVKVSFDSPEFTPSVIYRPTKIENLMTVEKEKNYKRGWAAFQALKFVNSYDDCLHIARVYGYKDGWAYHQWLDIRQK